MNFIKIIDRDTLHYDIYFVRDATMKHAHTYQYYPVKAIKINIYGTQNVIGFVIKRREKSRCTIYG